METNNNVYHSYLIKILKQMERANKFTPFPFYDTEYVDDVKNELKNVEKKPKEYYDSLPVAACKYCDKLRLKEDDYGNEICLNCGAVNEVIIYDTIFDLLDKQKQDEDDSY